MTPKSPRAVKPVKMRPRDARTLEDMVGLPRDNVTYKTHWILLDGDGSHSVTIAAQCTGQACTEMIHIPRRVFNRMVDWYMTPLPTRRAKGGKK